MPKEPVETGRIVPKVSQKTIDSIKAMGMTKALAGAKKANRETREALVRMYGAKRVEKAMATPKAMPYGPGNVPAYRPGGSSTTKPSTKSTTKKSNAYGQGGSRTDSAVTKSSTKSSTKSTKKK
jgi:hypothetical protein